MMKVREFNRERAEHIIRETDAERKKYYNTYTGRQWDSSETHHMILNSTLLGIDTIVDILAKVYEE